MFTEKENVMYWAKDTIRITSTSAVSPQPARHDRELRFMKRETPKLLVKHPGLSGYLDFNYLVVDKLSDLSRYIRQGCTIAVEPFKSNMGTCAVVQDASGTRFCILDKG
jgi:hypothetical protein